MQKQQQNEKQHFDETSNRAGDIPGGQVMAVLETTRTYDV
jgi:hypothetical protein